MNDPDSAKAVCPYFVASNNTSITCEWVMGSKVILKLGKKKWSFKRRNCDCFECSCQLRKCLDDYYRK